MSTERKGTISFDTLEGMPSRLTSLERITNGFVSVEQFGAIGDGVTNDLTAIQNAINYASTIKGTVVFKPVRYLVTGSIQIKSYVKIIGYGAEIYRASSASEVTLIHSTPSYYLYDISLEGITLISTEDRAGAGDYNLATVSNVMGMYIEGVSGLYLKNVKFMGLNIGLKLGKGGTGTEYNHNIRVDNLYADCANPILCFWTYDYKMTNSRLDASGTGTSLLHCFYIKNGCRDFTFESCEFIGATGAGIHSYNTVTGDPQVDNVQILNCKFTNCVTAAYIWSKATHFIFTNTILKGCQNGFYINDSYYITISNTHIDDITTGGSYILRLTSTSDVTVDNLIVDATGLAAPFILPTGTNTNFRLINSKLLNFVGSSYYILNGAVALVDFIISGNTFVLTALDRSRLRIESASSIGVISDNVFKVTGSGFTEIIDVYSGALVAVTNNKYKGSTNLCKTTDFSKNKDNLNMTTWAIDATRNIT